jgi:GNAT superfamily N-acetyltransferase
MLTLRRAVDADRPALRQFWITHWGDDFMVVRGVVFRVDHLQAIIAVDNDTWIGVAAFYLEPAYCEILSLDSLQPGRGVGTALVRFVEKEARQAGCSTLRLVTTNDNTRALRFYQKLGFELTALRPHAVDVSRRLKPSIPETGDDGIPIRDEIELQINLAPMAH